MAGLACFLCQGVRLITTSRDLIRSYNALQKGDYLAALGYLGLAALDWFTGGCFAAGTQVVTGIDPNNPNRFFTKNIEDIRIGDYVLTRDQNDPAAPLRYRQVTQTFSQTVNNLRILTVQNPDGSIEQFKTTDAHPIFVAGQGWLSADTLKPGDQLLTPTGQHATLMVSQLELHPEGLTVYNFEVDGDHSYFVLDGQGSETSPVWVHNGRRGCAAHISKVATLENLLKNLGAKHIAGGSLPEAAAHLTSGKIRFADLVFRLKTGELVAIQVGRRLKNGLPVIRERRALGDLAKSTFGKAKPEAFSRFFFVKY